MLEAPFCRRARTAIAVVCLLWGSLPLRGQSPNQLRLTSQTLSSGDPTQQETLVRLAGTQSQTSIAVDSTGQHIVIGFNDTRGFDLNPIRISGFVYSDDGGATFVDGGQLPSTGADAIGAVRYPQVFGDPEVKYLGGSNFVYFSIMIKKFSATGTAQTMCFHRSTDYGHTWEGPFEVTPATNPHGGVVVGNASDAADKEFADVDPETGRVLMAWTNFTRSVAGGVEISATYSDDIMSATPTWSPRTIVSATALDGQAAVPRFAAGSDEVYIAWQRSISTFTNNVGFTKSIDNGATFAPPVNVAPAAYLTMDQVPGNDRVHNFPSLAVDNSGGPFQGNLYLVYANNASRDGADVMLQRSTDRGVTFSSPIALNSRPGADRAQWFPWVTVDRTNGRVYAIHYDQGVATSGDLTETSVQFSDDGGATWSKPMPLSATPFRAGHGNDTGQPNLGDYIQAVAQNGELFAAFTGTTQPGFTDGLPQAAMTTPDVFFERTTPFKPSLHVGTATFSASGGNVAIDRGERVLLSVPLINYVTNPLFARSVAGISATLSSATAGVTIREAASVYPDLPPGATAANSTPFVIDIGGSFVPGTRIEFTLRVVSDGGSTTLSFTQATGTPIPTTLLAENFDHAPLLGLPPGWESVHVAPVPVPLRGNAVPWRTNTTFMRGSKAAVHANANDGVAGNNTRIERLVSPIFDVPAESEYVTLDFDIEYNTEDEPTMNVWAYDGMVLRVADFGPTTSTPAELRSVLAEAFAEEFATGAQAHYPKHLPRSSNPDYLQDLSAWAGTSSGVQHVRLKLPDMAGRHAQLRFEYTQDSLGTCRDVRPTATACGVAIDNVVVASVVSSRAAATETSVTSSQNPSDSGEPVTFTATVTSGGEPVSVGAVTFREGETVLAGPVDVDSSGRASFTTSQLTSGSHTIAAEYVDDGDFRPSSGTVVQTVDPLPSIAISDISTAEGNEGLSTAVFTLTLSAPTHTAVAQVDVATADGTAAAGSDYAAAAGSVSFAPGQTSQIFAVSITGDNVYEPDERFAVNLSNASHANIAVAQASATIVNDDPLPTITIGDVSVVEGNTDTTRAVFSVSLSNPSSTPISVSYATADGSALAASDYVAASGTLTFAALQTTDTIAVTVRGDFVIEADETFTVNLANVVGAAIGGSGQAVGTIRNDDTVDTTLAALTGQVTAAGQNGLLSELSGAQRNVSRARNEDAIGKLQDFIGDVQKTVQRSVSSGRPPLDPHTAAIWIEEAQSIIAALTPDVSTQARRAASTTSAPARR